MISQDWTELNIISIEYRDSIRDLNVKHMRSIEGNIKEKLSFVQNYSLDVSPPTSWTHFKESGKSDGWYIQQISFHSRKSGIITIFVWQRGKLIISRANQQPITLKDPGTTSFSSTLKEGERNKRGKRKKKEKEKKRKKKKDEGMKKRSLERKLRDDNYRPAWSLWIIYARATPALLLRGKVDSHWRIDRIVNFFDVESRYFFFRDTNVSQSYESWGWIW